MNIFIVEDNLTLRTELMSFLNNYQFTCSTSDNFGNIVNEILESKADLVLLDINLPNMDGYYVCKEVRRSSNIPIIIVTSRDSDMDEIMSMNMGADDFITKPYNTQILLARINSLLRRSNSSMMSNEVLYKGLTINFSKNTISHQAKTIDLTKNEMLILKCLYENKQTIVSRAEIMDEIWQSDSFIDDNTLTVNINRLRKKLLEIGVTDFIETKRGQGYMI
ncbi:response regulator transcription factor [Streptococcus parasanguinis]|uniref:response regulator transcription factor n=1 Tax=Streptococcus parasanguinis TaxID=1318 RepID=UPI00352D2333